jgi:hypothetical protein
VVKLGIIAEFLISLRKPRKIHDKPKAFFRLLSMTGANHLLLLRESLYSYCKTASRLPELEILNDGSLDDNDIISSLAFWPKPIKILNKADIIRDLEGSEALPYLEQLTMASPLGLKLTFIIARSKYGPQLFSDSDILWRADPLPLLQNQLRDCNLAIGREDALSINKDLAFLFAPSIINVPGPNSGCVWSLIDINKLDKLLPVLKASLKNIDNIFNEQTILAILSAFHGCFQPDDLCATYFGDRFKLLRRNNQRQTYYARHYVNILRHLFYIDAFLLSMSAFFLRFKRSL